VLNKSSSEQDIPEDIHPATLMVGLIMAEAILLSGARNAAPSVTIDLDVRGGGAEAAAISASAAKQSPAVAKAMQLDRPEDEACGDKRWVGASVCLATAITTALLLTWLTLRLVG
jgi:hypothetical protein